jgi:hypothetical protein
LCCFLLSLDFWRDAILGTGRLLLLRLVDHARAMLVPCKP